ncbi:GNAT family N-acetyltransferase [Roseibium alexandrii]|uniref:Protein involved in cellulose biosynthesis (CelD) n=1 Tax=Roseibium alexandrii TaxID=388408 RepID=A0A0M6ZW56_9HYPH|nr:GNAT family N-acetyltransferase [Roseibium alexandrii]CTQ65703.1 Protein involved in cellulose biosynthesis (CelD) [Roseibium alexandrii]
MDHPIVSTEAEYRIEACNTYDFLSEEYSTLFKGSNATAFQSPLWLHEFYHTLVPGHGAEPLIIKISSKGSDHPDAILPLVRETHFGIRIVQPADLGVADYNAIVGSEEKLTALANNPSVAEGILSAIQPYHLILFRKQRPCAFDVAKLLPGANRTPNTSCSYEVDAGAGYDNWFTTSVSKNMRKGLKRKTNGFEKTHGKLEFAELCDERSIVDAFQLMRELREARYEANLFSRPEVFEFYQNIAVKGQRHGIASTFVSKFEDRILSIDFGVRHKSRFLFLLGAFYEEQDFQRYSLGLLGLNELIRREAEAGHTIFDFTIGDEPYKLSFGAEQIPLTNITVTSGPIGRLAFTAYQSRGPFRRTLKKLMPKFS